ncbi:MAG: preprotein translocase subunit SecA [bacterium]|nr:preprotein translocase subunit SecA [bacterium]
MSLLAKVLRAGESKKLKSLEALAARVNQLEPRMEQLDDSALARKTVEFRTRLEAGEPLDDLEVEAFATVREAAKRTLGQRHYDVQVIGAGALHRGMIAEMRTGEGKTLVSTMPVYLNALGGAGVHVVTVNDYLAQRDAKWMGGIYRMLGFTVGLIQAGDDPASRKPAYEADVTYGTNNEFGFDYLRDNMAMSMQLRAQRGHRFAIVDEVDSILVDEARTPLIISGKVGDNARWYREFARLVRSLRKGAHYEVDEGKRQVLTTEEGVAQVERMLGVENMYDHAAVDFVHHLEQALRAKALYNRDVEYLVSQGQVMIVDEFTGRVLEGRRYSEGLHQAIEAKEGVRIKEENQTLAAITLQNYFRLYDKLAGMTGTAMTEASEFSQIYGLEVMEVPTHVPVARVDQPDVIYKTEDAKYQELVQDIEERHQKRQPVLVGTVSIEKSELVSRLLSRRGISHEVLNAKHHAREAEIIAQAGRPGAVTVATNMAGRGVDIQLGGNPEGMALADMRKRPELAPDSRPWEEEYRRVLDTHMAAMEETRRQVLEAGGLYVLGTERHESRRIDNQLRGRSGRQGDPGESRFYLSLGDDLMRRFASERVSTIMERLKMPDEVPIEAKMVSRAVERAQSQVESQNFEIRKNVLKYDEVMNRQREVIYEWRDGILRTRQSRDLVVEWVEESVEATVRTGLPEDVPPSEWDWDGLFRELQVLYLSELSPDDLVAARSVDEVVEAVADDAVRRFEERESELTPEVMRRIEQGLALSIIDNKWRDHLSEMDYLRAGIGLRAMGQRDPLTEYRREGYEMFSYLVDSVKRDTARYLYRVEVAEARRRARPRATVTAGLGPRRPKQAKSAKVGRNAPCPCGSGVKAKRCAKTPDCMAAARAR